ncbi:MAG: hypothetical protein QGI68_18810 [Pseudomonadales bacterium]|jgi:hypothetical protein|nr:hypothetical protein [Pseudomonadales bacterium]HJN51812.1 alpha/beta family hydrolase [Pseudomonadales bacterium]|tara:strand:- start:1046 stop:1705 length:660 start_codon:yes stop_codon:yes gene_type:complete
MATVESKFEVTAEKGTVSSILMRPPAAKQLIVIGHGAGANMRHANLERIATELYQAGIASFRYQFPYMERGGKGRDSQSTSLATVRQAVLKAKEMEPKLRLFAGGHSFGGRMTSMAESESPLPVDGLVFFSFPLHPAGKPALDRAEHLYGIDKRMLFLTGSRDKLADPDLRDQVISKLGKRATLHLLDTADHGYKILKRSRESDEDVFVEMIRVVCDWL